MKQTPADEVRVQIVTEIMHVERVLLAKNKKYGNSALSPLRIFSRATTEEQINVRLDDKLSRIANRQDDEDEDVELDIIGYLVLKRVWRKLHHKKSRSSG